VRIGEKVEIVFKSLWGWLILIPLSLLVPKRHNLVLFYSNQFADNIKYMYGYVHSNRNSHDSEYYFLTKKAELFTELRSAKLPVLLFPSWQAYIKILRAKVLFVDHIDWIYNKRFFLFYWSFKVQLWHGVGLKEIEKDIRARGLSSRIIDFLTGRFPRYDWLLSTSEFFTQNFFKSAFNTGEFIEFGYPRNDIFFGSPSREMSLGTDLRTIKLVREFRADQYRIVLYAPTFRDTGGNAIEEGIVDLKELSENAESHREVWVIKFHPSEDIDLEWGKMTNIIVYDCLKDVYPLLPFTDLLITDYSSIYLDYLLLDKPVVFFPYDYEKYIEKDRKLKFDYDWITPGPKCHNQLDLERKVRAALAGEDPEYKRRRVELTELAFRYKDGNAARRIWDYIWEEVLKNGS
jgi:CDP-glycerol glycerophosphotransferase (TagB/SpsB family)